MNASTLLYLPTLFQKLISDIWIKLISISGYIAVYPFFDKQNETALVALFFLIFADMITGLIASYKTGVEIRSARVLRTALKISIYYVMIAAGNLAELAGLSFLPIAESLIAVLAATELISILENCSLLGYVIPNKLLNKLKDFRDK